MELSRWLVTFEYWHIHYLRKKIFDNITYKCYTFHSVRTIIKI